MILNDKQIIELCETQEMITPYHGGQVRFRDEEQDRRVVSYGSTSFGYDARIGRDFKIFHNVNSAIIDPKGFDEKSFIDFTDVDQIIIPPNSFVLGHTVEYFKMPQDVVSICLGKSTYARCGLIVNVTPLEPGWEGHVTIEISNTTPLPAIVYADEGICQFLFFKGDRPAITYSDRGGKYMGQTGVTLPRM